MNSLHQFLSPWLLLCFYYAVKQKMEVGCIYKKDFLTVVLTSIITFFVSAYSLLFKLSIYIADSMSGAMEIMMYRVTKRTGFMQETIEVAEAYQKSLSKPLSDVILMYLKDGTKGVISDINAGAIIFIFFAAVLIYLY